MRETAIVQVDPATLEKAIVNEKIALDDGEREVESKSKQNQERRLRLGKLLLQLRTLYPVRGSADEGWTAALERMGISRTNAHNWMNEANGEKVALRSNPEEVERKKPANDDKPDGKEPRIVHTRFIEVRVRRIPESAFVALLGLLRVGMREECTEGVAALQALIPELAEEA